MKNSYESKFRKDCREMSCALVINGGTEEFIEIEPVLKGDVIDLLNSFEKDEYGIPIKREITCDLNTINYKYEVIYDYVITISGAGVDGVWDTKDDIHFEIDHGSEFKVYNGAIRRRDNTDIEPQASQ